MVRGTNPKFKRLRPVCSIDRREANIALRDLWFEEGERGTAGPGAREAELVLRRRDLAWELAGQGKGLKISTLRGR
jgi:hypothetical protein